MRRESDGLIEDIFEIAKHSPVAGAVITFILVTAAVLMGRFPMGHLFSLLLWLFAVLIAGATILGFISSGFAKSNRSRRLQSIRSIHDIHRLSPGDFERLIADLYRRRGYRVEEMGGPGDGGVDLILYPLKDANIAHLVQCKRYANWTVGVRELREFYGAMAANKTRCHGIFVTCGRYTAEARQFAFDKPIELVNGDQLLEMVRQINFITPAVAHYPTQPPIIPTVASPASPPPIPPICPRCRIPMVRRTAHRGANVGRPFWGCQNYPNCREIIDESTCGS
ncbi:MAG TPA: restriction endonuclease [Tepidisphaeraceae bacterium]|nr:restriction endonuclease [Tepidisphaeraceae bacterium]